jgi:Flp pilus assembly protein TadD
MFWHMNLPRTHSSTLLAVVVLCASGCGRKESADASQPLLESFKVAAPEVQQAVTQVSTQLKTGQYAEATRTLAPLVSGRPLTDAQKQAVGVALQQINQSVAANPSLDTKEMYDLRAKMFQAVHSGPRF